MEEISNKHSKDTGEVLMKHKSNIGKYKKIIIVGIILLIFIIGFIYSLYLPNGAISASMYEIYAYDGKFREIKFIIDQIVIGLYKHGGIIYVLLIILILSYLLGGRSKPKPKSILYRILYPIISIICWSLLFSFTYRPLVETISKIQRGIHGINTIKQKAIAPKPVKETDILIDIFASGFIERYERKLKTE